METHTKKLLTDAWNDMWRYPYYATGYIVSSYRFILTRQALPILGALIVDAASNGTLGQKWKTYVLLLVSSELLAYAGGIMYRNSKDKLGEFASIDRYPRYINQVLSLPYEVLIHRSAGDLTSKARSKADYFLDFINQVSEYPRIIINVVISFVVLFNRQHILAYAYIAIWVPSAILLYFVAKGRVETNKKANEAWDEYNGIYQDIVANSDTVTQFSMKKAETDRLLTKGKVLFHLYTERWRGATKQVNTIFGIDTVIGSIFAIIGVYSIVRGKLSIGTYILLQSYANSATSDISDLANLIRNTSENLTRATSLDKLADDHLMLREPKRPVKPSNKNTSIEFNNVSFTYSKNKDATLHDFNLTIPSGQKIGIVGKSGSGKTTITKLLLRLHQTQDGNIKVCGQDIDAMGSHVTRSLISYVPQDPILFHRSVRENILYGNENATERELRSAIHNSYSKEFIANLQDGVHTLVGTRGVRLSGGQRQRVAIARALLKNAPILIFDEATSALDSESEVFIQKAFENASKSKTTIVIAHRLSTLRHMDRIIVIDNGTIVEDGTHTELLQQKGIYSQLWESQSGGFIE